MEKIKQVKDLLDTMGKKSKQFIPTGLPTVDNLLDGGLAKKEMVVIGGPSGVGKSFLACQLLLNSVEEGFKGLYLSLEISAQTIASRLLGNYSNIKPFRLIAGLLEPEEYDRLKKAKADISLVNDYIHISDSIYTLGSIVKAIKETQPEIVLVDFIQSIIVPKATGQYETMSNAALELQKLAKLQDCVMVVFSQLSNRVAQSDGDYELLEYKGSGTIAQVADLGFWLYGDDTVGQNKSLTLFLRKNRRGIGYQKFPLEIKFPSGEVTESEKI